MKSLPGNLLRRRLQMGPFQIRGGVKQAFLASLGPYQEGHMHRCMLSPVVRNSQDSFNTLLLCDRFKLDMANADHVFAGRAAMQ